MNQDNRGFELLQHTADMGIRAWGDSLSSLFLAGASGLYAIIGEISLDSSDERTGSFKITDNDIGVAFRDFLAELLFLFETKKQAVSSVLVKASENEGFELSLVLSFVDMKRTSLVREVKAVTYHGLSYRRHCSPDGETSYEAYVVVDI